MKHTYIIAFFACIFLSCANDTTSVNSDAFSATEGQGGSLAKFALSGDYLYTVDEFDLNVFSISNPINPVLVNTQAIGFGIETIFSYKDFLYIGSQTGMFIYSIQNPEFPQVLSSVDHFTACDPVVANDNYAFVTLWSDVGCGNNVNRLEVYNIEDALNPMLINTRNLTFPKGLGLYNNYLIICDDEIKIFDVSDPLHSTLVATINQLAFDVIINNNLLIAIGSTGLYQYKLNPNNIQDITFLSEIVI